MDDDFKNRFASAKAQRRMAEIVGRNVYKFCFNGREAEWDNTVPADYEPEEIFTDFPATIAEEFHGELFSTLTPENAPWVEYEAGSAVPEEEVTAVEEDLGKMESLMSRAVRGSNYYTEGQAAFQDAVFGTIGLWIEKPGLTRPVRVRSVASPRMYLCLGPEGSIDDRFRCEKYYARDLPALFPRAKFPRKVEDKIKNSKGARSEVKWGFWPKYDDPENVVWRQEIRVDGEAISLDMDIGEEGAVPLVVGRFNAVPGSPWGRGPGWRMLPTIMVLNAVCEMTLEGMDRQLSPAVVYPQDGLLDLSDGIEAGLGYPAMPGSPESIVELGANRNLDYGYYSQDQLETQIRYGFYREIEQRGKTPPSASQFIGQEQKQLRRIARPAAPTWAELGVGLLKRFEYLERQSGGALEGVKLPMIESGIINPRPISPLERAQAREEVLVSQSILEMTQQSVGPEQAGLLIDMPQTMRNVKSKLKDSMVVFRTQEELMKMAQAMQQMGAANAPQE